MAKQVYTVRHTALGSGGEAGGPAFHEGDDYITPSFTDDPKLGSAADQEKAHIDRLLRIGAIAPKEVTVPVFTAESMIPTTGSEESARVLETEGVTHPVTGEKIPTQVQVQQKGQAAYDAVAANAKKSDAARGDAKDAANEAAFESRTEGK